MHRTCIAITWMAAAILCLSGCGRGDNRSATGSDAAAPADPALVTAPPLPRALLEVQLQPGDRFPLRKTVEQELVQSERGRGPETSRTKLELLMAITVEQSSSDGTRLGVRYDRVRYEQQVGRMRLNYDSMQPPADVPLELAAYHGMAGNGFSFTIGKDNRIAGVHGFAEFLEACLRRVPVADRPQVVLGVESNSGADGVADFIDDTIGLFPADAPKAVGDSWKRPRRVARPVPMHIDTTCTLREFTDDYAIVDIHGDVTPVISSGVQTVSHHELELRVNSGRTDGHCVIFRDTGLPKESHVVHTVSMTVTLPDGTQLDQQKRIVTTVEAYPTMRAGRGDAAP